MVYHIDSVPFGFSTKSKVVVCKSTRMLVCLAGLHEGRNELRLDDTVGEIVPRL